METFVYKDKKIQCWLVSGEVLSSHKRSETNVYSSGGGGNVYQGTGRIEAPQVYSETTTKHEFWLKDTNGAEIPVQLAGADIPLREGQKISVVFLGLPEKNQEKPVVVFNHATNKRWDIKVDESIEGAMDGSILEDDENDLEDLIAWFFRLLWVGIKCGIVYVVAYRLLLALGGGAAMDHKVAVFAVCLYVGYLIRSFLKNQESSINFRKQVRMYIENLAGKAVENPV